MTVSWERWRIWATGCPTRRWATFCVARRSSSTPSQTHGQLERLHSNPPGGSGGNRLLHSGSPHVEGPDHILRAVLPSPGEPAGMFIRNHAAFGLGVD